MTAHTTLIFEGKALRVLATDTVATALLGKGVRVFSRGPKYHRPRGPFCFTGDCAQCHMRVGGEPNIPACQTPVCEGMRVERQNVLGSGDTDLLRAVDFLYPEGIDHHHLMTHFKVLNTATKAIARRLAGIGELPESIALPEAASSLRRDVVVIGAGPAGLAAAREVTRKGLSVSVIESSDDVGGRAAEGLRSDAALSTGKLKDWRKELTDSADVWLGTRAVGLYEEGGERVVIARTTRNARGNATGLVRLQARGVIVATGGHERPLPFEANDLPGVFAGRGLLRAIRRHGLQPGKRAVVLGSHPDTLAVARGLREANIEVAGILDPDSRLESDGTSLHLAGAHALAALGRSGVRGLRFSTATGREQRIACDLIAVVGTPVPSYELASEAGAEALYDEAHGGFAVVVDSRGSTRLSWLFAAGTVTGSTDSVASGQRAGAALALSLQ